MHSFDSFILEKCNKYFGTNVSLEKAGYVFDIYGTKKSFEGNVGMNFDEAVSCGTAGMIEGFYVFMNDVNL